MRADVAVLDAPRATDDVPPPRSEPRRDPRLRTPEAMPARQRVARAVTLVVITMFLPGSAQLAAGSRRWGRIAVRVWLGALAVAVALGLTWLVSRRTVLTFATNSTVLGLVALALLGCAVAWPVLVVDAWRLGRPLLLPRRVRLGMTALLVVAALVTCLVPLAAGRRVWAAAGLLDGVFGAGSVSAATQGRYNVLLLGGDAGPDRVGTRPDSITLASIDAETGRTVLFSMPRNLENVRFPEGSSGAAALPQGWTCGDKCLLNGLYTWGSEHAAAFPGARDPGAEAMKQAVSSITGLTVNYYVLVDLKGFQRLINAMGGVELTVRERVPIGGGTSKVSGYIEPGTQRLDGYHALWYARSRHGANDYARMARQRCVMNAMVRQMDPATLLAKFQGIAAAAKDVMSTDLPASELPRFIDLGVRGKSQKISSVAFVPPLVNPAYPDFAVVHERVLTALVASRRPPKQAAAPAPTVAAGGSIGATAPTPAAAASAATAPSTGPSVSVEPEDVGAVCSAS